MTIASLSAAPPRNIAVPLFAATVFSSAALVFMVEPMIARMILPRLGGSPAVWNTCMAFFQTALLAGYFYAHLLRKLRSARLQVAIHISLLAAAALILPIQATGAFGLPPVGAPIPWLLCVLAISVGAPFTILSATAPLLQAWYARVLHGNPQAENPYVLYSASNLGSMLALIAYPTIVEPLLPMRAQTFDWAFVYCALCLLMAGVGALVWNNETSVPAPSVAREAAAETPDWPTRVTWVMLAAVPSSLMLGTTTYISNDVASVPFLWVLPLALYLLTFIISFQATPIITRERALLWHAVSVAMAAAVLCMSTMSLGAHLLACTGAFFFGALICHQRLAASRPPVRHLTEFYFLLSLGGVLGGVFNAFLAPVIFSSVAEYPLALALTALARPWNAVAFSPRVAATAATGVLTAGALAVVPELPHAEFVPVVLACAAAIAAFFVSGRALLFALVVGALCAESVFVPADKHAALMTARSFFGVHRVARGFDPALGGDLHLLFHGTTIHGAQPQAAADRCDATTYYAPQTPIGQVITSVLADHHPARIGVVGLGSGTVATYTRAGDRLRFFEIDPEVERIARDRRYFTYLSGCAKGNIDVVLGDARLTLPGEKPASYDLLLLDAFSADTVPTHLLTVNAFRIYLRLLKPDGVVLMHLSNRNLALEGPAAAAAKEIGVSALMQHYAPPAPHASALSLAATPTQAMLMAKSEAVLAAFRRDRRWRMARDHGVHAWSDDYTNVFGALIDHALGE
ncbi:MAG TPA: fused MFS/spermidine synthase [Rhizomicrobium sp.]|jgi:SAM-dependent methyltransferase|nr:fused MFS/spermidine synthase [Rhizomicrobium sp.]